MLRLPYWSKMTALLTHCTFYVRLFSKMAITNFTGNGHKKNIQRNVFFKRIYCYVFQSRADELVPTR